jgi:voltage-gated sodium channel
MNVNDAVKPFVKLERLPRALGECIEKLTQQCELLCKENEELRIAKTSLQENEELRIAKTSLQARAEGLHGLSSIKSTCAWTEGFDTLPIVAGPAGVPPLPCAISEPPSPCSAPQKLEGTVTVPQKLDGTLTVPADPYDIQDQDSDMPVNMSTSSWKEYMDPGSFTESVGALATLASSRLGLLRTGPRQVRDTKSLFGGGILDSLNVFADQRREDAQTRLAAIAHSITFKVLQIVIIFSNTIYMGISADVAVRRRWDLLNTRSNEEHTRSIDWRIADILFAAWFALELLMRIAAEDRQFFVGKDWKWNIFDAALVCSAMMEFVVETVNLSFLRILRVARIVRIVKVVRTVKSLQSLRNMVFALLSSLVCLFWAFVMILIVLFLFGLIFLGAVLQYIENVNILSEIEMEHASTVYMHFGSLPDTMTTLFAAVTGGQDWMNYGDIVKEIGRHNGGDFYFYVFVFYIGFCFVGMFNVVTGIFVDSAVCTRTDDEVVQCWRDDLARTSEEVRNIFAAADVDSSGTMSIEELLEQLENPRVSAYFSGLEIDPSEAGIIFTLLDTDGDNQVTVDEFINGTMRLKGHAKSVDIMTMMFDQARFHSKFNKLCSYIEDQMRELRDAVVPGSTPAPRMFVPLGDVLSQQCESVKHGEVLTNLVVGSQPSAVGKSTSGKLGFKSDSLKAIVPTMQATKTAP